MSFLDFLNGPQTQYNVYRNGSFLCSISGAQEKNKIEIFQCKNDLRKNDIIINPKNRCSYKVVDIEETSNSLFYPNITLLTEIYKENSANTITNNTFIIGSNNNVEIHSQIANLPAEYQDLAKELLKTLELCIKEKAAPPKNFKEKFGDFIQKYGNTLTSFGSLALQLLALL